MQPYRPDRVVQVLTAIVSFSYYLCWVVGVVVLAALPLSKAMASAGGHPVPAEEKFTLGWPVPATLRDPEATVQTPWGGARLIVEYATAELRLPLDRIPWGVFAIAWVVIAVWMGLALLILHHLRGIFRSARDGAPFDAQNALRMRTVGLLLLAAVIYDWALDIAISLAMRGGAATGEISVSGWLDVDVMGAFTALVVVALAEVFRRGAELENEQALVV